MNATNFKVCVFSSPITGNLVQFRLSPEQQAEADRLGIPYVQHAKALYCMGLTDKGKPSGRMPDAAS